MTGSFRRRRQRTLHWLERESPGEQMLELYLALLELQEPLYERALASGWGEGAKSGGSPALDLERLPAASLAADLGRFAADLAPVATEVLAGVAGRLEEAGDGARTRLLAGFLARRDLSPLASELGVEATALAFFPRAFLQPVAEALASAAGGAAGDGAAACPVCGWPPQVGVLRDEPEVKGRRYLACSLCASEWSFRRFACAACGETATGKLLHHTSESLPHLRVEECQTCGAYLKTVDLRKDGRAVPVVDDLATPELDLWCAERGLRKVQPNLMGL